MESSSEISICCLLMRVSWYSLVVELHHGIDGRPVLGFWPVRSSNGEGMFPMIGVHLYSMRLKYHGFSYRVEWSMSFFTIFTIASANPLDWGKWGEIVTCCTWKSSNSSLNSLLTSDNVWFAKLCEDIGDFLTDSWTGWTWKFPHD